MSHHERRKAFHQRQQLAARAQALAAQVDEQVPPPVQPTCYYPDLSAIRRHTEFQTAMQLDQWGAVLRARFGGR